jgi:hypothetical protein
VRTRVLKNVLNHLKSGSAVKLLGAILACLHLADEQGQGRVERLLLCRLGQKVKALLGKKWYIYVQKTYMFIHTYIIDMYNIGKCTTCTTTLLSTTQFFTPFC